MKIIGFLNRSPQEGLCVEKSLQGRYSLIKKLMKGFVFSCMNTKDHSRTPTQRQDKMDLRGGIDIGADNENQRSHMAKEVQIMS